MTDPYAALQTIREWWRVREQHASALAASERVLRREISQARDAGCTVAEIAEVLDKSRTWVYDFMGRP